MVALVGQLNGIGGFDFVFQNFLEVATIVNDKERYIADFDFQNISEDFVVVNNQEMEIRDFDNFEQNSLEMAKFSKGT